VNALTTQAQEFLKTLFEHLHNAQLDVAPLELDHICYRVATLPEYDALKTTLASLGTLLTESQIGGRPIATYKLFEPICFEDRKIFVVELPAPKVGAEYKTGFEHAEFVIQESFESFMGRHAHLEFDLRGMGKRNNAEVRIGFGECSVKFHGESLEGVIEGEIS
jgi:predicted metalloenzyme YecM